MSDENNMFDKGGGDKQERIADEQAHKAARLMAVFDVCIVWFIAMAGVLLGWWKRSVWGWVILGIIAAVIEFVAWKYGVFR